MAGETWRTNSVMDPEAGRRPIHNAKRKTSVYSRLEESPGSFAFAQAVGIVRRYLRSQGVNDLDKALRFRVNPNLSFPPGDMESLAFTGEGEHTRALLELNLMGLHGAGSPLPTYFTEYVAQHQDDPDALRDFFDIFNHELITILFGAWRKYRYYLQYREGATDDLSRRFFANENSPLSGEFQKGEAYTYPQKALLCLERSCPDFSQTSKGEQQWKSRV